MVTAPESKGKANVRRMRSIITPLIFNSKDPIELRSL
jgi:hypothetical protein